MSLRLHFLTILRSKATNSSWKILDRGWLYSHTIAPTFLSKQSLNSKTMNPGQAFVWLRCGRNKLGLLNYYWDMNYLTCDWKECTAGKPANVSQAILFIPLHAPVQWWRYMLAAVSASAFLTTLEITIRVSLANFCSRNFIIFSTHALSLSQPVNLRCCGSIKQTFAVASVPLYRPRTIAPGLVSFFEDSLYHRHLLLLQTKHGPSSGICSRLAHVRHPFRKE